VPARENLSACSVPDLGEVTIAKGNLRCMTRRIDHRTAFAWSAHWVYRALVDVDYLTERLRTFGDKNELVSHNATDDDVRFQVRQVVRADSIPPLARPLVGTELTINRSEVWRREDEGQYAGEVAAEVPGMPCSIVGSQWLRNLPEPQHSELLVQGSVHISIPLVGGKMEQLFVDEVGKLLTDEDKFTSEWLSRH
jgi:hypothetical protein